MVSIPRKKKHSSTVRKELTSLRRKANKEELDPKDLAFYPSHRLKNAQRRLYDPVLGKLRPPRKSINDAYLSGDRYVYYGVATRIFSKSMLCRALSMDNAYFMRLHDEGIIPAPFMTRNLGSSVRYYWIWPQIKWLSITYISLKYAGAKRVVLGEDNRRIMQHLRKQTKSELTRFYRKCGFDYRDEYDIVAGKYGVIWKD